MPARPSAPTVPLAPIACLLAGLCLLGGCAGGPAAGAAPAPAPAPASSAALVAEPVATEDTAVPAPVPAPAAAPAPAPAHPAFARVAALSGTWRTAGRTVTEEHWTAPVGRNMTGLFRMLGPDGSPRVLELLMLTAIEDRGDDGGLEMRFRHFDADLQPWEAERDAPLIFRTLPASAADVAPARIRFQPIRDDSSIAEIVYDLRQPDRLHVTVDFAAADQADIDLHFTRREFAAP